ncbi:hypothetical protein AOL_s00054g942 [Orbilia oligospora ATCC 24927]|uniref:Ricin B lectin domain-containing protein n=1 Tax=Arthrobotrys oligospora (strain ATCC 24927 / CBS 115.81 / DSM 1491) TaxID=756982 RepID=G1X7M5_ARTOA|nr:hypothetical protein AOL_s00054g942 [Orbilia oligospora ATCC 24927]EGX50856.1 hypothetical protein AOL_s00054g942 [Orbilia oligospora ATCC 24927]
MDDIQDRKRRRSRSPSVDVEKRATKITKQDVEEAPQPLKRTRSDSVRDTDDRSKRLRQGSWDLDLDLSSGINQLKGAAGLLTPPDGPSIEYAGCFVFNPYFAAYGIDGTLVALTQEAIAHLAPSMIAAPEPSAMQPTPEATPGELQNNPLENASHNSNQQNLGPSIDIKNLVVIGDINAYGLVPGKLEVYHNVTAQQPYAEIFRPKTSSFSLGAFFPSMKGYSIDSIELENVTFSYLAYEVDQFELTGVYLKSDVIFKGALQPVSDFLHEYFGQENPSIHFSTYIGAARDWGSFPSVNQLVLTGSIEHMSAKLFDFLEFTRVGVELLMDSKTDLARRTTRWEFGYGFFGDLNISVVGSLVPLQCHYHLRKFSQSYLLSVTLRDDEWKEVFGIKGLNLSSVHFQAMISTATKNTAFKLRVEADMQWRQTTIPVAGTYGSDEYSLEAYIGNLSLHDVGELFQQMMDAELDIFDHDVVLQSMYINISKDGFVLAGTVIINGHSSANAKVAFKKDGISISGGVSDMSFKGIDIHKAELDIFIGTKSQNSSERETKFAIMGDVSFAGIDLRVGVYTKKPGDGKELQWAIYGEAQGDLKTSRLCPELEGTFLDISLNGLALMASNHEDSGGKYNTRGYPLAKGIQFCARIAEIPALKTILGTNVEGTILRASYNNGAFSLGLILPGERTMTFTPDLYTGPVSFYIQTGGGIKLGLQAEFTIKLKEQDPLRFDLGIKAGVEDASGYGEMVEGCKWVNPCGVGKNVVISGCAVDIGIVYTTFAISGIPGRIGLKGRIDIGEKQVGGAMLVSQTSEQLLAFTEKDLGVVDLVKFASVIIEKELPRPDNFLHITDFDLYLSSGATIANTYYPRGVSLKGDMLILGKRAQFDCKIGSEVKIMATIESFSIGPLKVTGAANKDPIVDAEISSTAQRVYIDGAVSVWGASAAIHLNADFHPSPKFDFAIQLKLSDLFLVQLQARMTGNVNYKDLKTFENADFAVYAKLEQHIVQHITQQLEQQINCTQQGLKGSFDSVKKRLDEQEKNFQEGCQIATEKLAAAQTTWNEKRKLVEGARDSAKEYLESEKRELQKAVDDAERTWKTLCSDAKNKLDKVKSEADAAVDLLKANLKLVEKESDEAIRIAQNLLQNEIEYFDRVFGAAADKLKTAREAVEKFQRAVDSIEDELNRKIRQLDNANVLDKVGIAVQIAALHTGRASALGPLTAAQGALLGIEEGIRLTGFWAAKAGITAAEVALKSAQDAKNLPLSALSEGLDMALIFHKNNIDVAEEALTCAEKFSDELKLFDAARAALDIGCPLAQSSLDVAEAAVKGLGNCMEFLAFELAKKALAFAESNTTELNLARYACKAAEDVANLGLDIVKWGISHAGKLIDINKIEFEGSLKSLIADGPPLRVLIQGVLCGGQFAVEIIWQPHFNLVAFIKALFDRLWEMIKSGARVVENWAKEGGSSQNEPLDTKLYENTKYIITNVATGTAIDFSGTDGSSISGWSMHGWRTQQWTLESYEDHWRIRNVESGRYLAPSEPFEKINGGTRIISSTEPANWNLGTHIVDGSKVAHRMFVPDYSPAINMDLWGADSADGTEIKLWSMADARNQLWYFSKG